MAIRNPRRSAWEFLQDSERNDSYLNLTMNGLLESLDPRDRPFATELVYGSVRMRRWLDHVIDRLIDRQIDDPTRSVLRLACYEALKMDTADHAVVNEYVELAKSVIGRSRSSLINAVLRRLLREERAISQEDLPLGIRTSHPDWIVRAFSEVVPQDALETELLSHNESPSTQIVSFVDLDPTIASKSSNTPHGYQLLKMPNEVDAIRSGGAFVQDEGSQVVCEIALSTDSGRDGRWLDLCAGPGGKFGYLSRFIDTDHLMGNEIHPHRANLVSKRAPGFKVHVGDGRELAARGERFDRILLDAPCTGIGALRRRPDARWRRSEADLKALIVLQRELLDAAAELLSPKGIIIYATCSPHLLETKVQVVDFLRRHPDFLLKPIEGEVLPAAFRPAVTKEGMVQLLTGRDGTDAMFVSLLAKVE